MAERTAAKLAQIDLSGDGAERSGSSLPAATSATRTSELLRTADMPLPSTPVNQGPSVQASRPAALEKTFRPETAPGSTRGDRRTTNPQQSIAQRQMDEASKVAERFEQNTKSSEVTSQEKGRPWYKKAWNKVKEVTGTVTDFVVDKGSKLATAVSEGVGGAVETLAALPGKAVSAISSIIPKEAIQAVSSFMNATKELFRGIAKVAKTVVSAVRSGLSTIASFVSASDAGKGIFGESETSYAGTSTTLADNLLVAEAMKEEVKKREEFAQVQQAQSQKQSVTGAAEFRNNADVADTLRGEQYTVGDVRSAIRRARRAVAEEKLQSAMARQRHVGGGVLADNVSSAATGSDNNAQAMSDLRRESIQVAQRELSYSEEAALEGDLLSPSNVKLKDNVRYAPHNDTKSSSAEGDDRTRLAQGVAVDTKKFDKA